MADIVIGARRSSPQRNNLRSAAIAVALGLVCLLVANFIYDRVVSYAEPDVSVSDAPLLMDGPGEAPGAVSGPGPGPEASPAAGQETGEPPGEAPGPHAPGQGGAVLAYGQSSLGHVGSIAVLRLRGIPQELGATHGRLLGSAIAAPGEALASTISHTVSGAGIFGRLTHDARLRWRYRFLDDGIPGHQLVELANMLGGARASDEGVPAYEGFVRQQAALDLGVPAPWSSGAAFRAVARSLSFVATLRGTSGDRLLIGRTFALPGAADGGDAAAGRITVSFVAPRDVIPYASVGWPGLVGVVSGINAEGIAVMVHPVRTRDVKLTRPAQPMALLARDVLENARTLDDAIGILQHATPLGAAAFVIVDGNSRQWAVVERTPSRFGVRHNQPSVVTDLLTGESFADDPENDRAARIRSSAQRTQRVQRLLGQRPAEPADVAAILRDRRSPSGVPLPLGHRGAIRDVGAVHTALFDASAMVLWVADGPDPGARLRAFDLRHELRGEGARPVPPGDLPADADYEPSVSHQVRVALAQVRQARRHWQAGRTRRAREMVQRALAHAPELPEALELAGDLARSSGDRSTARRYYQRYLDVGPDDLGAEEEVRALLGRP